MVDPGRGVSTFPPKEVSRPNPPRPNGVCVWVCVLRVRVRVRVSHIIVGFWPIFKKGHSKQEFFLLTELDKTRASPSPNTRQFRKSPNIGAGHTVANSKNRHSSLTFFFSRRRLTPRCLFHTWYLVLAFMATRAGSLLIAQ